MSKMKPRLSVIIPAFNSGQWIAECVASAAACAQGGNLEILVIDDGSTDSTPSVVEDLQNRYGSILRSFTQRNAGPSAARNVGRIAARGEYLMYLDADDYLLAEGFRSLLDFLDRAPVGMILADWRDVCARTGAVLSSRNEFSSSPYEPLASVISNPRPVSSVIVRASGPEWDVNRRVWEVTRWVNRCVVGSESVVTFEAPVFVYRQNHSVDRLSVVESHTDPSVTGDFWLEELAELDTLGSVTRSVRQAIEGHLLACAYQALALGRIDDCLRFLGGVDRPDFGRFSWARPLSVAWFGLRFGLPGLRFCVLANRLVGRI